MKLSRNDQRSSSVAFRHARSLVSLAYDLHQLANTSNEYFTIVLNFLRSSIGGRYLQNVLDTSPDRRRSGAWEWLGRLYGFVTCLLPLSRRVQTLKDVLFAKVKRRKETNFDRLVSFRLAETEQRRNVST